MSREAVASAQKVARAELGRDHEMYRPNDPHRPFGAFHWERGRPSYSPGGEVEGHALFFTFTPPPGYRYGGHTTSRTGGNGPLNSTPSLVLEAGSPVKIYVETVPANVFESQVKALNLRFWPPVEDDRGEPWTCPCGSNVDPEGDAHWIINVDVALPPATESSVPRLRLLP